MSIKLWGIILTSLLASSIEPILVKVGVIKGISPFLLISLRFIFAGAFMLLVCGKEQRSSLTFKTYRQTLPLALLLFTTNTLTVIALLFSNPSLVITLVTFTPVMVGIASSILGYEVLSGRFWLGVVCAVTGVFVTLQTQLDMAFADNLKGATIASLAVLTSTCYRVLLGQKTKLLATNAISFSIFMTNGSIGLMLLPFFYQDVTWSIGGLSIWIGVAAACANLAFVYAIKHIGAARMSVIDLLQRPLVVILSMLVLHETITLAAVAGIMLVGLGVYMAQGGKKLVPAAASSMALAGSEPRPLQNT